MNADKRNKLRTRGWSVGSAADFLGISDEDAALIEMKLALAHSLRIRRQKRRLTQSQLAERIASSQSRVAKAEAADRSVSLDFLCRSLLHLGASQREIGQMLGSKKSSAPRKRNTSNRKSAISS